MARRSTVLDISDDKPRATSTAAICLLLRPDMHVVWRGNKLPDDPARTGRYRHRALALSGVAGCNTSRHRFAMLFSTGRMG